MIGEDGSLTAIRLGSANVLLYLIERGISSSRDLLVNVEQLLGKNMNLLVHLSRPGSSGVTTDQYMEIGRAHV